MPARIQYGSECEKGKGWGQIKRVQPRALAAYIAARMGVHRRGIMLRFASPVQAFVGRVIDFAKAIGVHQPYTTRIRPRIYAPSIALRVR